MTWWSLWLLGIAATDHNDCCYCCCPFVFVGSRRQRQEGVCVRVGSEEDLGSSEEEEEEDGGGGGGLPSQ